MTALGHREEEAMAISFPAPEAAAESLEHEAGERAAGSSLVITVAQLLRRGYERVCSAIFDADGDCMRL
jgi:hypothetical protein